jgi:predicted nucleotidyltransferase
MKLTFEEIQHKAKKILNSHVEFCFLLGSADTPRFNSHSDIDLAVFWKDFNYQPNIEFFEFNLSIVQLLEDEFQREIDLVTLNDIDVIFGMQVLETGRLLFDNNDEELLKWKVFQLSRYPDFKYSRKIIEDNILKRKKYV